VLALAIDLAGAERLVELQRESAENSEPAERVFL
jgi:hypothetical protein